MKIKHLMVAAALLIVSGSAVFAQQSKSDESLEFRPHWSIGVQGGVAGTIGEASLWDLLSPAAAVSAQWNFHHALGLRLGVGGWQGKGAAVTAQDIYAFRFGQVNADLILDLTSLIGGFDHQRLCSAYVLAGVGGAYGFDNSAAAKYQGGLLQYYWENKFFVPARVGLGVDFRLSDAISLGLESNANILSDHFNSKKAGNADWQINVLAGLKFRLGKNTRPSQAYADKIAAEEAAAAAAAAAAVAAEAARLAAEKAAAEKAAAEKAAAEKAAAEKAAAEKAAAERAAIASENSKDVFFTIGSAYIRKAEDAKLVALADWMKANADFYVELVGYADKNTGSASVNEKISEKRAVAVKNRLVQLGVPAERISSGHKGDTVQPFAENDKNRVVICTLR
ncbi:MAG: OmpA family protein [Bacteroidales bacterium]|nr:OmpA family protein [Bacteroidales bacterium]